MMLWGGLYILPVSGSPILAPFGETTNRLSCQSGDLCRICKDVFRETLFMFLSRNCFLFRSFL